MGELIPYKTFIAHRGENEIKRLERKERLCSINRLLGCADTLDWGALIIVGITSIVIPCLAIAGYLYLNNITLMEFYSSGR